MLTWISKWRAKYLGTMNFIITLKAEIKHSYGLATLRINQKFNDSCYCMEYIKKEIKRRKTNKSGLVTQLKNESIEPLRKLRS